MSPDVLNFLAMLLGQVSVAASAADFDEQAALVSKARRELLAALSEAEAEAKPSQSAPNRSARRHPPKDVSL